MVKLFCKCSFNVSPPDFFGPTKLLFLPPGPERFGLTIGVEGGGRRPGSPGAVSFPANHVDLARNGPNEVRPPSPPALQNRSAFRAEGIPHPPPPAPQVSFDALGLSCINEAVSKVVLLCAKPLERSERACPGPDTRLPGVSLKGADIGRVTATAQPSHPRQHLICFVFFLLC